MPKNTPQFFGADMQFSVSKFRALMVKSGYPSIGSLALVLGANHVTIERIASGFKPPSLSVLCRLKVALRCEDITEMLEPRDPELVIKEILERLGISKLPTKAELLDLLMQPDKESKLLSPRQLAERIRWAQPLYDLIAIS